MEPRQLDDLLARAREVAKDPDFDKLTIKDLKVAIKPERIGGDGVASIVTVIILIVDT